MNTKPKAELTDAELEQRFMRAIAQLQPEQCASIATVMRGMAKQAGGDNAQPAK